MDLQVARDLFTVAYGGVISGEEFTAAFNQAAPMREAVSTLCTAQQFMWEDPWDDKRSRVLVPEGTYMHDKHGKPVPMKEDICSGKQAPK